MLAREEGSVVGSRTPLAATTERKLAVPCTSPTVASPAGGPRACPRLLGERTGLLQGRQPLGLWADGCIHTRRKTMKRSLMLALAAVMLALVAPVLGAHSA